MLSLITVIIIFTSLKYRGRAGRWEVEQAATSTSIEKRLCNDEVRYTWAEFKDYDDIFLAAEIWEAVLVVATPELISPSFEPGFIVRVLAAGWQLMHAEGCAVIESISCSGTEEARVFFKRTTRCGLLRLLTLFVSLLF